jgi:AraC family transcriptional regulator
MISSLEAHRYLRATMTLCSFEAGWRSLLLRAYDDPPVVEPFTTPQTEDHLIVLVTKGACNVEGLYRGKWSRATYGPGSLGMTAPGEEVTLRWRGTTSHSTLQLHLPAEAILRCKEELLVQGASPPRMPNELSSEDPLLRQVILGIAARLREGAPEIYAQSAAQFLTMHLLIRHAGREPPKAPTRDALRMQRVCDYMHAHLSEDVALEDLAKVACLSRFHLIRMFKHVHGETPYQRLTRLRIERACQRLAGSGELVSDIALDCGFTNPTHFAAAFRRLVGMSPREYRNSASDQGASPSHAQIAISR